MRTRRRGGPGGSDEGRGKSVRIPSFGSNQCTACSEKVVAFSSQGEVIHLIDIASGEVTALAGSQDEGSKQHAGSVDGFGPSTRFNEVVALELLRDGRLAILDRVNDDRSVVRIMDLKSKTTVHLAHVEKVEGYGSYFPSMRQLHDGRLLVAARSGLYSVNVETGLVSSLSTRAYRSMAELPDGRVAFTDAVGIHLLDPATLAVATLAKTANVRGLAAVLKSLDGIAITPNGEIAVTDRDRKCIWRVTLPSPQDEFVAALKSLDGPLALRLLDRAGARVDDRVRTMLLRETINGRSPLWECLAAKANCSRLVERIASTETSIDEFMSRSHTAELLSAAMKERQLAVASRIIARGIQIDESTKSTIVEQLSDLQSWRNAVLDESCAALVDLVVELEPIKFSFDSDVLVAALGKDSFFSAMRLLDRGVSVDAHAKQALLAKNAQLLKKLVLSRSDDSWSALGDRILKAAPDLVPCAIQSALEGFDPKVAAHLMEHFDAIPDSFMLLKRQDDGSSMIVKLFLRDGYRALAVQLAERSKALAEEVYSPETLIVAIEAGNDAAVAHLLDKGVLFDESRLSSDCLEQMANESDTAELVDRLLATGRANGLKKTFASPAERLTRALDSRNPDLADRLLGSGAVLDPAWCVHFFEVDSEKFIQLVLHPSPVVPRLVHQIMELYKSKRAVVAEDHGSSWTAKLYAERWARCFIAALRTHDSVAASWIIDELPSVLSDKRVKAALGQNHLWQELVVLERCSGLVDRFLRSNPDLFADALVAACSVQNLALASRLLSPGYLGVHTASNPHTEAQVERIPKGLTKGAEHASVLRKLFCKPSYLPLVRRLVDEFPLLKKGVFSSASLVSLIEAENAPAAQWLIESEVTLDTKTLLSHGGWRKVFSSPLQDCIVITDHLMRQHPELKEATTTREMLLAALRARDTFAANRLLDMGVLVDGGLVDVLTAADGGWYDVVADASDACVALTDRLMVLSPALREAAVSTKTLLAALESRSMFAANRLLDLGTMFDDELLSAFAASDDGDGPWRALILDTSAACTALVDRLVVLSSVLKDAAVSPKSLFAALDACNAVAANRLIGARRASRR